MVEEATTRPPETGAPTAEQQRETAEYFETARRQGLITVEDGVIKPPAGKKQTPKSTTAADIDKMEIPPIQWIIDGILPTGLAMLSAPSKYFKSYMALDMAISVCTGGTFLQHRCSKADVLYMDLESTPRRPRDRIRQIMGKDTPKPDNLHILTADNEVGRIANGFEETVQAELERHPDIKLVIVDVLQLIRQPSKTKQSEYDRDYADAKVLKRLADKYDICILVIHHMRKMRDPSDVFNNISGSVGIMGALDFAWAIAKKNRTDDDATLHITGRDIESQQFAIRFNKQRFRWEYIGTAEEVENQKAIQAYNSSKVMEAIRLLVSKNGGTWSGSAEDLKKTASLYGVEIEQDIRRIGREINEFKYLLEGTDKIVTLYDIKTRGKRRYEFNVIT